jgi:molybdate transport system ATP-binding protein
MDKNKIFLSFKDVEPHIYGIDFPARINWKINYGEQWAVVGPTGSGKTLLADLITGKYGVRQGEINFLFGREEKGQISQRAYGTGAIRRISFESVYLLADYKNMYYQQRFNATENELSPTVADILSRISVSGEEREALYEKFNLYPLLSKHLIKLSSGELRRFLIAIVLMQKPELIIFDNPFIGLDKKMRQQLNEFFTGLGEFQQMIFLVPAANEIPDVVTHILPVKNLIYGPGITKKEFEEKGENQYLRKYKLSSKITFPDTSYSRKEYENVFTLKNVSITYGDRYILEEINWQVKKGEKWALLGSNGSGKSTLLSLIVGDNPQAYAQYVEVFGRRRGTGESIWDIKKPIGYISSEMHLFFQEDQPAIRIVGSGFFDTIGLFRKCDDEQLRKSLEWMKILNIENLAEKSFLKLSGGEQRLVLLARTLVKNPELIILDEPFHGLDMYYKERVKDIIEQFCSGDKTLVYVTHRREEIPSCVDKFFELEGK